MIALGLMAGTSLDGIDAALLEIVPGGASYAIDLKRFATIPYEVQLRERLLRALPPHVPDVVEVVALGKLVGAAFGEAAALVAGDSPIDYVASHGQTLYHDGARAQTLQIGDPFAIRERTHASVVYDFRSADCTAGGHGAPLVPYVDALFFASEAEDRVILNLGGIANLTIVPRGAGPADVIAFDSGPGNMLIDAFVFERTAGALLFDRDGEYAAAGTVAPQLLAAMMGDPYFVAAPPKSTGREHFGAVFLERFREPLDRLSLEDGCATLCALTAATVGAAIERFAPPGARVVTSGGGASNLTLLRLLAKRMPGRSIGRSDFAMNADAKEAIAFAVLGYETLRGRPAGLPKVTGAAYPALLGAIAPAKLDALLAKIAQELARSPSV